MTHVFVYGTLRTGESNHRLLHGAEKLGSARSEPCFTMVDFGGFPGITSPGETAIVGEVYAVDGATLARLDRLEGHPDFYPRSTVVLDDGAKAQAYILRPAQVRGKPPRGSTPGPPSAFRGAMCHGAPARSGRACRARARRRGRSAKVADP